MDLNSYKEKFKLLFDKFGEEGFHLKGHYAKAILKYFQCCQDKSAEKQLLETTDLTNWVVYALFNVEKLSCKAVIIFLIEILALLVKNEHQYCKLIQLPIFHEMVSKLYELNKTMINPDFQLALVKFTTAQSSHNSGIIIMAKQKAWVHLLNQYTHHKPIPIANAIYNFISNLIWKLNDFEEETVLIEVLQYLINPIMKSDYICKKVIDLTNEEFRSEQVISSLSAILTIFSNKDNYLKPNNVINLLKRQFMLRVHLHLMVQASKDENVLKLTFDVMFRYYFASYRASMLEYSKSNNDFINEVMTSYSNIINWLLQRPCLSVLLYFLGSCLKFWSEIDTTVISDTTFESNGQTFYICNQFALLLVVPMLTYASCCEDKKTNIDIFLLKLTAISTEHSVKSYYQIKAHITETKDLTKSCLQGLKEIFKLKGHLHVAQAGIIFQALYHVLNCHVYTDATSRLIASNSFKSIEDLKILTYVLENLLMLLKEHEIHWYESIEVIYFQNTLMNILKQHFLPTKLLLQVLSLIDWSIKKFLSPDLTLLVDIRNGSTITEIGKQIREYLNHEEWEVRDSALQVLLTCTEVCYVKYEPLQKLISEYDLIVEAASAAINDSEYFVQASALRCLGAATKVERTWRDIVAGHPNIYVQLVDLLQNNPEGIVRKEAANVLTELYVNQSLSQQYIKYLYVVMKNAATNDLYWEVQLSALNFWKHVIQRLLSDRGMIDGKFPAVTFSKDKRKIIVLNKAEIVEQLILLMNQLSSNGCLTILKYCLNEDCSVTVLEQAYNITKDLINLLDKFDLVFDREIITSLPTQFEIKEYHKHVKIDFDINDELMIESPENCIMDERDAVIDKILATSNVTLIEEMCQNENHIDFLALDKRTPLPSIEINTVNPSEFIVNFKQTDYLKIINEKRNWDCDNLNTFLDEVMYGFAEKCTSID